MMNRDSAQAAERVSFRAGDLSPPLEVEEAWRAASWGLLAGLLAAPPAAGALRRLAESAQAPSRENELDAAFAMLCLTAGRTKVDEVDDEYHELFIGLGRGELLPYASWYQTGFLMERPLSDLRSDLRSLGYCRSDEVHEPEDHAAALCEVMAMLIRDGQPLEVQARFFERHIANWMEDFFEDLASAESAVFYQSVGRLGVLFMQFEKAAFNMQ